MPKLCTLILKNAKCYNAKKETILIISKNPAITLKSFMVIMTEGKYILHRNGFFVRGNPTVLP